jgi:hypothetical protein
MMAASTPRRPLHSNPDSVVLVQWTFIRGTRALTCEVRANGRHSYDLFVIPHWHIAAAVAERYDRPESALRRHAEIARSFREAGWLVVREGAARGDSHAA